MLEIAMFHRIEEERPAFGVRRQTTATTDDLERYLRRRQSWKPAVPGSERFGHPEEKQFLITFDDGYQNTYTEAWPIIRDYHAQTVVFPSTGLISGDWYPYELLIEDMLRLRESLTLPESARNIDISNVERKQQAYTKIRSKVRNRGLADRRFYLHRLRVSNEVTEKELMGIREQFLSWDQLRDISQQKDAEVGSHGCHHVQMTNLSIKEQYRELAYSKRLLENRLQTSVDLFAYPYGAVNKRVGGIAAFTGYRFAFGTAESTVKRVSLTNKWRLPRVTVGAE